MILHDLLTTYHRTNAFLATNAGLLFISTIETVLFFLITYMLLSELRRTEQKIFLKRLILSFTAFFLGATLQAATLAIHVFANNPSYYAMTIGIINTLKLAGVVLITNAFINPQTARTILNRKTLAELTFVFLVSAVLHILAVATEQLALTSNTLTFFFETFTAIFALQAVIIVAQSKQHYGKYAFSIALAFLLLSLKPLLIIINVLFFESQAQRLLIVAHPLPLLATLLLFRVVYLRLVDKASLRERLAKATTLYEKEKEIGKLKEEFLDLVSHEFRTPLTTITLYTKFLQNHTTNEGKRFLSVLQQETSRLSELVNDLLDIRKLEQGKMKLKPKLVAIKELIAAAAPPALAESKQLTLSIRAPKTLKAHVDPDLFKHLIQNLYSNAIKFTPEGGAITISARRSSTRKKASAPAASKNSIEIKIKDTGVGIPKQDLPHLFDKFFQSGHHLTRTQKGTGLGLAIVKEIVDLHRGTITVTSTPGKGTTFTITIPQPIPTKHKQPRKRAKEPR